MTGRSWRLLPVLVASLAFGLAGCVGVQLRPQERSVLDALDDLNIQTRLNANLLGESASLFANVDSTVIEGRVHLTGSVRDNADRLRVTRIAWQVPGVREVVNDIEVASGAGVVDAARDRWITAQVRARIIDNPAIRDSNFSIDTENGIVYIHGIAQDEAERERIADAARKVPEVRRVVNYAILKDDPRRAAAHQGRRVTATAAP